MMREADVNARFASGNAVSRFPGRPSSFPPATAICRESRSYTPPCPATDDTRLTDRPGEERFREGETRFPDCMGPVFAGVPLIFLILFFAAATAFGSGSTNSGDQTTLIVVAGAPGEETYQKNFEKWVGLWEMAARAGGAKFIGIGLGPTNPCATDLDRLKQTVAAESRESAGELWIVLIGHGTFDGKEAKFNLRGPDLSARALAELLNPFHRPLAVVNCASASGPFINLLSATNRVVITATRSGYEQNYARFGQYFSEAIADPGGDLDKDGQISLLEAFLMASRRVVEFYNTEGRLATEHALLDDNGDGLGTPADWFRGIRATKKARDGATADGLRAHQFHLIRSEQEKQLPPTVRARRDELELSIERLHETKRQRVEEEYYQELEKLLVELAKLYGPNSQGRQ